MSISNQLVIDAAEDFIKRYGPVTAKSAQYIATQLKNNKVKFNPGINAESALEVMRLVDSISYVASPSLYESGDGKVNPEAGKLLLNNPALNNPEVMMAIANRTGDGEYSAYVQDTINNPDSYEQSVQNTEVEQNKGDQEQRSQPPATNQPDASTQRTEAQVTPTASGGGFQRVASGVFQQEQRPTPLGQTRMRSDGTGGTYTSGLASGDNRAETAKRQQLFNSSSD